MAISILMPRTRTLATGRFAPGRSVARWPVRVRVDRVAAFATGGLLAYLGLTSAWFVQIFITASDSATRHALADVVGLLLCLPVLVALVLRASRDARGRQSWWLLAALAVLVCGTLPVGGVLWLFVMQFLAGATLIVVPLRAALPAFAATVILAAVVARGEDQAQWSGYMAIKTVEGGLCLAILVALVRAVRQAQMARVQLAEQAVIAERLRIDETLTREIGMALERIVALGEQASAPDSVPGIDVVLATLVGFSRQTLTETRRLLASYQAMSAEAELQVAVTLLAGAGVRATLEMPSIGMPDVLTPEQRAELRAAMADLLADDGVTYCVIALVSSGRSGECRLSVTQRHASELGAA